MDIRVPSCWDDLDDRFLRYVFSIRDTMPSRELKAWIFLRFAGIHILGEYKDGFAMANAANESFYMPLSVLAEIFETMNWLDTHPHFSQPRLLGFDGFEHIDSLLRDVPFSTYLKMENLWQAILLNADRPNILHQLFSDLDRLAYSPPSVHALKPREPKVVETALSCWMCDIHTYFYAKWPHLFRHAAGAGEQPPSMESVMNAEIRALTDGDITREAAVLQSDTWRALTELNEKAREAQEFNDKYK